MGALFPTRDQTRPVLVLDVGANTDCKPSYLHQFALLGNIYAKDVFTSKKTKNWPIKYWRRGMRVMIYL